MMYKNGDEFSGEFKDSRRYMGVMTFKQTGDVYRGEFNEKGLFHGGGDLKSAEGDIYKGLFVNGAKEGQGQMILKDNGGTYVGDFNQDLMHGNGCFTMPDGSEYVGEFFEGVQHGDGMIITSSGTEIFGRWINGKYQQLEYSIELEGNHPAEEEEKAEE